MHSAGRSRSIQKWRLHDSGGKAFALPGRLDLESDPWSCEQMWGVSALLDEVDPVRLLTNLRRRSKEVAL